MADDATYLLGYHARVQTEMEMLVFFRLREVPDIAEALGNLFAQMSDNARGRWLRAIAALHENAALGERLQSVYAEVTHIRDGIGHTPFNIQFVPEEMKLGASRWMNAEPPTPDQIAAAQTRLHWIENWISYLLRNYVNGKQWSGSEWVEFHPERPPEAPPQR